MQQTILNELSAMEDAKNVRVLLSIESGSRSWGFASEDSDYDVRYVYIRPMREYLRLEKTRDTIEWRLDDELDIVGWDITKFLQLMRSSNPTVYEWLGSPIVYREDPCFASVRSVAHSCFNPVACAHHYLGMARKHSFRHISSGRPTLKRYLYAMRATLACKWSIQRQSPIPIPFDELREALLEPELMPLVNELLEAKSSSHEADSFGQIPELDAWLEENLTALERNVAGIKAPAKVAWSTLDDTFAELLDL